MASGFAEDVGERGTHRNRGGGLEAAQGVDGFRQGVGGDGGDVVGLVPVNQQAPIGVAGFAQARKDGLGVELLFEGGHHDVIAPRHFDRGIELDGVDMEPLHRDGIAAEESAGNSFLACHQGDFLAGICFVLFLDCGLIGFPVIIF